MADYGPVGAGVGVQFAQTANGVPNFRVASVADSVGGLYVDHSVRSPGNDEDFVNPLAIAGGFEASMGSFRTVPPQTLVPGGMADPFSANDAHPGSNFQPQTKGIVYIPPVSDDVIARMAAAFNGLLPQTTQNAPLFPIGSTQPQDLAAWSAYANNAPVGYPIGIAYPLQPQSDFLPPANHPNLIPVSLGSTLALPTLANPDPLNSKMWRSFDDLAQLQGNGFHVPMRGAASMDFARFQDMQPPIRVEAIIPRQLTPRQASDTEASSNSVAPSLLMNIKKEQDSEPRIALRERKPVITRNSSVSSSSSESADQDSAPSPKRRKPSAARKKSAQTGPSDPSDHISPRVLASAAKILFQLPVSQLAEAQKDEAVMHVLAKRSKNTEAARRSRGRRREHVEWLEGRVDGLENENGELREKIRVLMEQRMR